MNSSALIVGAGPVGLTLAIELARYGVPVRIVDQAAQRTDKSKAIVIWSRTLELFERAGLTRRFLESGKCVTGANIIAGDHVLGHIDLTSVQSAYPFALMKPQSETEALLEEHLVTLGVRVERSVSGERFIQSEASVETTLRGSDGREEIVRSAWLIGCDGAHSLVRHGLGVEFHGETLLTDWVLADVQVHGLKIRATELAIFWHGDGVLAFFPLSETRYRVIADVGQSKNSPPPQPTLQQIQTLVDQRAPEGISLTEPIWLSGFRINERKVKDYRDGRVFLAGDAAHVHSPAGGQGMNTGMQDAFNLAWKLALAARGFGGAETLLDSYSVERSAIGDQVLAAAGRLTAVSVLQNHAAQAIRNLVAPVIFGLHSIEQKMAETLTEVSVRYLHSPLNGESLHDDAFPKSGERIAPFADELPFGVDAEPRFLLCAEKNHAITALLLKHADLLDPTLRAPRGEGILLIRPDGYAACSAKAGDVETIEHYFHRLRGQ